MMDKPFYQGLWRLADPKISITSLASMIIGASVALRDGYCDWQWHAVMLLALFCMEVAKNAWGEVIDYDSGTDLAVVPEDRTNFSGGKRVMVDNLLSRRQTWGVAFTFAAVGIILGALIVFLREPMVFWIGAVGLLLGWSYHGPPLKLAYRGGGELDVVICYGPLIAVATYMIQAQGYSSSSDVIWLSVPLGVFIAAFLWVNEFPDHDADAGAGKRNLIVQLGTLRASRLLPLIYLAGFVLLALAPMMSTLSRLIWLGFFAALPATYVVYWTWRNPRDFYRSRGVQPAALMAFVIYALMVASGVVLGGHGVS